MTRKAHLTLGAALLVGVLAGLPACADKAPDPGATRTEAQAAELRERLKSIQTDR